MTDAAPGRITIGGKALETAWWGPAPDAAPTLVLLHEGLGSVALWRSFPASLAAATGFGVFAWSRAGYGKSDSVPPPRPVRYMHDEAALLGAVLDAAGIGACVLVGHSDGASIAAIYAGTERDARVRGLALLAPHFFVEDVTIAGIEDARERYRSTDLRGRLARYHADVDATFWGWNGAWLNPEFRAWNIEAQAAGITVPMLIVQGLADPYGTRAQVDAAARLLGLKLESVLLDGVGHTPHIEAVAATLDAVAGFSRRALRG
ncbi:MAG: alpha/beta fold hydrolase [Alphaproteobacteria bacterium]|nr:alpha/beta fold hydrolase [Alphaproteobacteria bacterium]